MFPLKVIQHLAKPPYFLLLGKKYIEYRNKSICVYKYVGIEKKCT